MAMARSADAEDQLLSTLLIGSGFIEQSVGKYRKCRRRQAKDPVLRMFEL